MIFYNSYAGLNKLRPDCGSKTRTLPVICRAFLSLLLLAAVTTAGCESGFDENIAVYVNGRPVTMKALKNMQQSGTGTSESEEADPEVQLALLDRLINEELIIEEAERRGLLVTQAELDREIEAIKADYPNDSFKEMLIREYIDFDTWKEGLRRNLLIAKSTEAIGEEKARIDTESWENFFQAHRSASPEPVRILVRHLTASDRADLEKVLKEVRSGKTKLEKAAKKVLGSGEKPGPSEPVWVYLHRLPPEIAQALSGLEVGGISDIVETEYGFSIFQVLEIEEKPAPDPAKVLAGLRRQYLEYQRAQAFTQWLEEAKGQAKIVFNPVFGTASRTDAAGK